MFKLHLHPPLLISGAVFLAAFILQLVATGYLLRLATSHLHRVSQRLKIQITQDLAGQLSRALTTDDDLAALGALKASRHNHPQLREAILFDSQGKISLHTDPGKMGKNIQFSKGPWPRSPEVSTSFISGRWITAVLTPLSGQEELFLRAYFDQNHVLQGNSSIAIRFYILILATSLLIGLVCWSGLKRRELAETSRSTLQEPDSSPHHARAETRRVAELLLSEIPRATLALTRDNFILAVNDPGCKLLNCRADQLAGQHLMRAPLPSSLIKFYQKFLAAPEQPVQGQITLFDHTPAISIKVICSPPASHWEWSLCLLG
ncbi:hypothetical protein KAR10_01025 [bacterium]|nr:hypothetical protein [bacterium]